MFYTLLEVAFQLKALAVNSLETKTTAYNLLTHLRLIVKILQFNMITMNPQTTNLYECNDN